MPTIFIFFGFRFMFYSDDHEPIHVHVLKVWIDATSVYAMTMDGKVAKYDFEQWPALRCASETQRKDFYLSYSGIHWPQIDEDLSFEGMFANANLCQRTATEDSVYFA